MYQANVSSNQARRLYISSSISINFVLVARHSVPEAQERIYACGKFKSTSFFKKIHFFLFRGVLSVLEERFYKEIRR